MINCFNKKYHTIHNFNGAVKYSLLTTKEIKGHRSILPNGFFIACCDATGFLDHIALMETELQNIPNGLFLPKLVILVKRNEYEKWTR